MTPRTTSRTAARGTGAGHTILGVPARIMRPRLILLAVTAVLVCFGVVMIFSASSVEALSEMGDAAYYVKRQLLFVAFGLVLAVGCAFIDYHDLCGKWLFLIWLVTIALLIAVRFAGSDANGATRWVELGPIRLQPSEFAKITVLLAAANIANAFLGEGSIDTVTMFKRVAMYVAAPGLLILVQPDKGSAAIVGIMVVAVADTAGLPRVILKGLLVVGAIVAAFVVFGDSYSRERVVTMLDPWLDPYGSGYQLTRGFMAFGSGGLLGTGLGMSRMKYSYLPEAHNDFIFAIIGEEFGLVGTLAVLALFALFIYEGLQIARNASDLTGRLVGVGATTIITMQFFLNIMGVLGLFPLSGKPLPFLSYGGSSIMSCLAIVGVIMNVSLRSELPETVHDARRRAMTLAPEEDTGVGEARPHRSGSRPLMGIPAAGSAAATGTAASSSRTRVSRGSTPLVSGAHTSPEEARRSFRVVEGGAAGSAHTRGTVRGPGAGHAQGAGLESDSQGVSASEFGRIDLGPSASERLRSSEGPEVRVAGGGSGRTRTRGGTASRRTTRRR